MLTQEEGGEPRPLIEVEGQECGGQRFRRNCTALCIAGKVGLL
jgi:hypothetical protein